MGYLSTRRRDSALGLVAVFSKIEMGIRGTE
jgi:hypothetical protein